MLNKLLRYEKFHSGSVRKNWFMMIAIWMVLILQIMLSYWGFLIISLLNSNLELVSIIVMLFEIVANVVLVILLSVSTCFDVPCCWNLNQRKAKFSIFRNLHILRLVLLTIFLASCIIYIVLVSYSLSRVNVYLRFRMLL